MLHDLWTVSQSPVMEPCVLREGGGRGGGGER